jgi:hypothetical protein
VYAASYYLMLTSFVFVVCLLAFFNYQHIGVTHSSILPMFSNSPATQQQVIIFTTDWQH